MRILLPMSIVLSLMFAVANDARAQLRASVYASGLTVPVAFVQDPTDRAVQLVVEQRGVVRAIRSGAVLATPFLDIQSAVAFGGERGLLGLAFAPDYATSGRVFINFNNTAGNTVIARYKRSANPVVADASSRFDLRWGGPAGPPFIQQGFGNHNGGNLAFGPDGYLYIGLGEGGDPARAQNPQELLGKMLRIDVNVPDAHASGYVVPPTNPFVSGGPVPARPEIWSFGFRNPWRYSFDDPARGGTGALIIGDVGQSSFEEVDYEPPGAGGRNYGWPLREGAHDYTPAAPPAFLPLVDPIHEYTHAVGFSITGGLVYRGLALGGTYRGRYFFADFSLGRVWSIALTIDPGTGQATTSNLVEHTAELGGATISTVSSFGLDTEGELYIVSYSGGRILKVLGHGLPSDFDADIKADPAVYRPSNGGWYSLKSSTGYSSFFGISWGLSTDTPVAGDYDGDGKIDPAVYRAATGNWYMLTSSTNYSTYLNVPLGASSDVPVAGDYDGDGKTDPGVYSPSTGIWTIAKSTTNYSTSIVVAWGLSTDAPAPGDYDGDGKIDPAVFRPSTGGWHVLQSKTNFTTSFGVFWGLSTDVIVSGDYDGDGKIDPAVFRPSTGGWHILRSRTSYSTSFSVSWGLSTDTPAPGDFDGDGRFDPAVFRSSTGNWYVLRSSENYTTSFGVPWGLSTDVPILKRP